MGHRHGNRCLLLHSAGIVLSAAKQAGGCQTPHAHLEVTPIMGAADAQSHETCIMRVGLCEHVNDIYRRRNALTR